MSIILTMYLFASVLIGLIDTLMLIRQEEYFLSIDRGDLEFYNPKPILGLHNIIFAPSLLVVKLWQLCAWIINKLIYRY